MNKQNMSRRDMNRLVVAAIGGLLTGAYSGCGGQTVGDGKPTATPLRSAESKPQAEIVAAANQPRLLQDPHVCRGINTCRNKGKPGTMNSCAGEAHCATVPAHDCNGMNDCKGQGGCGENPGENECSGKGGCAVPLSDKTWPKARKRFEELMAGAGKRFQEAPAKEG